MDRGLYKVLVNVVGSDKIEFGFNKMSDALEFMSTCVDTVDGFNDGNVTVTIYYSKED